MPQTDFLVIGSGIAGLSFALKTARAVQDARVIVVTKADEDESNTKYAQGGIAVALNTFSDSFENHVADTLLAGDGLCNREIVEMVVREGPMRLDEIVGMGADFDKDSRGDYALGKEGGHSANRIVHHKDATGLEIEKTLLARLRLTPNIEILSHHFAVDLITEHHLKGTTRKWNASPATCFGAYVLDLRSGQVEKILSRVTLLASGGLGQIYRNTTNPLIATGDGIAMAHRAGAEIRNMEFIQFHPTSLFHPGDNPSFLISEAVRGFGALLRTKDGKRFMARYDERGELASRDIVARAIDYEMKVNGDEYVYLDLRHLDNDTFAAHFPTIREKCLSLGIRTDRDMIPVVPAAHYLCGGISVDDHGRTTITNLYACGECSSTGLHGANRLASNSLLEALVFSHHCYTDAVKRINTVSLPAGIPEWSREGTSAAREHILTMHNRKELRDTMSDYVGIVRSDERLGLALKRIEILDKEAYDIYRNTILSIAVCELRNLVTTAGLVVKHSLERKENRGVFYNVSLEKTTHR